MNFKEEEFKNINYDDCITNITSSIEKYYSRFYDGIKPRYNTNKIIDKYLDNKEYKNVIIFLFDAMGHDILKKNLKEKAFLRVNEVGVTHSTYPPTTANCTTAFITGQNPIETGWIGWSTYFKDLGICVDNYPNVDVLTKQKLSIERLAYRELPITPLGKRIEEASNGEVKYYDIHCKLGNDGIKSINAWIRKIKNICNEPGKKYIYVYWNNPDAIMHIYGTKNNHSKLCLSKINRLMKRFYKNTNDTFSIVTADHGMVDVSEILFYKYDDVKEMMKCAFTCDARTVFFFVKDEYKDKFAEVFNKHFGDSFYLKTKDEVIANHIFGYGEENPKFKDLIGDFVGFAYGNKYLLQSEFGHVFKGHHAGLLKEEMEIPIIILEK